MKIGFGEQYKFRRADYNKHTTAHKKAEQKSQELTAAGVPNSGPIPWENLAGYTVYSNETSNDYRVWLDE